MGFYVEIEDKNSLMDVVIKAKAQGFLSDISTVKLATALNNVSFPVRFRVNTDGILEASHKNPVVTKMFSKKIDDEAKKYLYAIVGAK